MLLTIHGAIPSNDASILNQKTNHGSRSNSTIQIIKSEITKSRVDPAEFSEVELKIPGEKKISHGLLSFNETNNHSLFYEIFSILSQSKIYQSGIQINLDSSQLFKLILKGAHFVIQDNGIYYNDWKKAPQSDLYSISHRSSSHYYDSQNVHPHYGVEFNGKLSFLKHLLFGLTSDGHTFLQFERDNIFSAKHLYNFIIHYYSILFASSVVQIGPMGYVYASEKDNKHFICCPK